MAINMHGYTLSYKEYLNTMHNIEREISKLTCFIYYDPQ